MCTSVYVFSNSNMGENTAWSMHTMEIFSAYANMTYYSCQNLHYMLRVHLLGYFFPQHHLFVFKPLQVVGKDVDPLTCQVVLHVLDSLLWIISTVNFLENIVISECCLVLYFNLKPETILIYIYQVLFVTYITIYGMKYMEMGDNLQ